MADKVLLVGDGGLYATDAYAGMPGDGVTDERDALAALLASAMPASGGGAVLLGLGTHRVASSLTLDRRLQIPPGAVLKPDAGATITLASISAGRYPIFDLSAGGSVAWAAGGAQPLFPEWWGSDGQDATGATDTPAWQAAVDAAHASGGGMVLGLSGRTYWLTLVQLRAGVVIDLGGATAKRPAAQGKFTRMFTTTGSPWSADYDSPLLVIRGGTIDGNRAAQGAYTGYELEQQHLIFLQGDPTKAGRLRVNLSDLVLQESAADGVAQWVNTDLQMTNVRAVNCWRGGWTLTGGNSRAQITNLVCEGDVHASGIDIEVDGAGYGGTRRVEVQMTNVDLGGDFDVGVHDGSVVRGVNVVSRGAPFILSAPDSRVHFVGGSLVVGAYSSSSNRIVNPHDVTFDGTEFVVSEAGLTPEADRILAAVHVYFNTGAGARTGQRLRLNQCRWRVAGDVEAGDTLYAVYVEADMAERDNRLIIDGGEIPSSYDYGVRLAQGGTLRIRGLRNEADVAHWISGAGGFWADVEIDGVRTRPGATQIQFSGLVANNRVRFAGVELDESENTLIGPSGWTKTGRRTIYGAAAPTAATHGMRGDRYVLHAPTPGGTSEWVCTTPGAGAGAVWKPATTLGA